ncbi:MAG: small multi-drug export protein [Chloroflexi bacterium]|nr:small multi-drug export protein [Chloroflexota bacterium]
MDVSEGARTLLAAMVPVGELRLAIPLAIYGMGMPWYQALPLALVGNMVPVLVLVPGLEHISRLLLRFPNPAGRLFQWWTRRVQVTQEARFRKYGAAALVLFVAVPLPLTGAWTGSLAAWAFRVPARQAIWLIGLGVAIAGVIVTALTVAGVQAGLLLAR